MSLNVTIKKDFGSFVLDVDFKTKQGIHGLLGASGCGKSITLKCIAGVVKPDSGTIILDGVTLFDSEKNINLPPQRRRCGLLFQNYALFPNMTVLQNIMSGLHDAKDKTAAGNLCIEMMERLSLTGLEKHKPNQLSGGQQQRAALARILITKPKLLMLDEPFSALDSYLRWQTELEIMDILKSFGGSALLVSHNRDEIYRMCDTVSVLSHGSSEHVISVQKLFSEPETLSSCILSCCKNFSRVGKRDGSRVEALDWGVFVDTGRPVGEEMEYIGVRSEDILMAPLAGANVISCKVKRIIEDIFTTIVMVSTPGGEKGYSLLQAEAAKQDMAAVQDIKRIRENEWTEFYVLPEKVMLLKK